VGVTIARKHYWQYILDEEGTPVEDAEVRIYLADIPAIEANIFLHPEYGGFSTSSVVDLRTNENGFFEVWFGDEFEIEGGYGPGQNFRITWTYELSPSGSFSETIQKLSFYSPLFPVDLEDNTDEQLHRMISNILANRINTHTDTIVPSSSPHDIVPYSLFEIVKDDSDNYYNKVVSNKLVYQMYELAYQSLTAPINASAAEIYSEDFSSPLTASAGVYYEDVTHNLNNNYPIVKLWKDNTENIVPIDIERINKNTVRFFLSEDVSVRAVVIG
jgi:hypothetical protein